MKFVRFVIYPFLVFVCMLLVSCHRDISVWAALQFWNKTNKPIRINTDFGRKTSYLKPGENVLLVAYDFTDYYEDKTQYQSFLDIVLKDYPNAHISIYDGIRGDFLTSFSLQEVTPTIMDDIIESGDHELFFNIEWTGIQKDGE